MLFKLGSWFLARLGYEIVPVRPFPHLVVGGAGVAELASDDGTEWLVTFDSKPLVIGIEGTVIDGMTPSERAGEGALFAQPRSQLAI